jgi:solute carrier family 12 sodium/potassium/chloride transporter 2
MCTKTMKLLSLISFKSAQSGPIRPQKFGTLAGVFTPTVLTILGAIMYLRHGWVVGNAGVLGALLVVGLAVAISVCTALALSAMVTNIRIGAGGAFSIISQSLGLEIGGSIGIPFYFSQALAVAMYVFGFREGVHWISPELPSLLVDLVAFISIVGIAAISTSFAFKIQNVILLIILASLFSIFGALFTTDLNFDFEWIGKFPGTQEDNFSGASFWTVFAVFFPAVTGVMAGARMSGELKDPRNSIPKGTLWAIVLTSIIYIALIFAAALLASPEELVQNYTVFIDKSLYKPLVVAGLLGATFSSALGSLIGAPRILLALGEKNILPHSKFLAKTTASGEPRNALWVTSIIVLFALLLRNLNAIAPLITMFFMITYCMINVVVWIEQSLGLPSYRPTMKVPLWVPVAGTIGSLLVMFIINPVAALMAGVSILFFYKFLIMKKFPSKRGDSRSGLFTALAEWATKMTNRLSPKKALRVWQPDLLIPVVSASEVRSSYKLIHSLIYPKGSIKMIGFATSNRTKRLAEYLDILTENFKKAEIITSSTLIKGKDLTETMAVSMQALSASFFRPNTLFITLEDNANLDKNYNDIVLRAAEFGFGVVVYVPYGKVGLGLENRLNLWLTNVPQDWQTKMHVGNNDLGILSSLLIQKNWKCKLRVLLTKNDQGEAPFNPWNIQKLYDMVRFPANTTHQILPNDRDEAIEESPSADLNIMEIPDKANMKDLREMAKKLKTSCLFTLDSGNESALV